jgi:radical SAM superfamily enzyme YgiQ (UPF0313 family)
MVWNPLILNLSHQAGTKRMKVFLCDLVHNQSLGTNQISGGQDFVVPLNIASLAVYAKKELEDSIEISLFKYPQDLIDALNRESPSVIGFSNYIWNQDINAKIAANIRKTSPDTLIMMGGPSIWDEDAGIEEFLKDNRWLDVYIPFEGERPFLQILKSYINNGKKFLDENAVLPGCAFLVNNALVHQRAEQNGNVEELSSPYLTGVLDEFLQKGLIPLFETNRGCPFQCTFCAWGNVDLNKVRKFSIDRVYEEMDYVSQRFPNLSSWIIADANFGMLSRDIEISKKIKEIKRKTPALDHILIWESKNTSKRNLEIARILGNDLGEVLVAVQTLDEESQVAIKRDNISLDSIPEKVKSFHSNGVKVQTHVLSGLPGETYSGHLNTLRKCFQLGFDDVQVFSTLLFSGSEMATPNSVETYNIQTRYRLRQGSFGEYNGIKSIESEEIIRANSTITEDEMLSLRPLHWLIWYGWNHGFLKPVLRYASKEHGINPLDVMLKIIDTCHESHPLIAKLFADFCNDAQSEWFESRKDLEEYYSRPENWDLLFTHGFSKAEFKFNSLLILEENIYDDLLTLAHKILKKMEPTIDIEFLLFLMREKTIHPDSIFNDSVDREKSISIPTYLAQYVLDVKEMEVDIQDQEIMLQLTKPLANQKMVKSQLSKYNYSDNKLFAVEKTLGAISDAFTYQTSITQSESQLVDIS